MFQIDQLATPGWVALGSAVGALGTWLLNLKRLNAAAQVERDKILAHISDIEVAERNTFRAELLREVSDFRVLVKECEADRDVLRGRVTQAEKQIALLQASNEIMERWMLFFKERHVVPADFQTKSSGD